MDFLGVAWGWIAAVLGALNTFWQWIALGVVLTVVALVVRRVEKWWDERKAAKRISEAQREKASASEKRAQGWIDYFRLEAGRLTRWHVTKDESDPYVWVLTNRGRDQARHVFVGVYPDGLNMADNLSFEVGRVESLGEVRVRIGDPAQAESTFFVLSWSDSSPTEQSQTLSLAGAVRC